MTSISVIIPTWNRESTIKRAVLSALNQTYPVTEVLVCDDGSTDRTKEIIEGIGNSKVKWLSGQRAGMPSVPRNRGIKASTGEWLAFLDSDDEWLPAKVERQLKVVELYKTDAVCSNAYRILPNNDKREQYFDNKDEVIKFEKLVMSNHVICSSCMIKRSLAIKLEGFPESPEFKAIEDYYLWLKVATSTDFAFAGEPLVNYFDYSLQSIRDNKVNEWQQREKIFAALIVWMGKASYVKQGMLSLVKNEYRKAKRINNPNIFSRFFNKK